MTARFIVADVFEGLASLEDGSVDLIVTSPPFLALRSYLPSDHPDKSKEIGSEATPAEFIDTLLAVTAELRRVLAPHGSICVELGDTYAGSGGAGGDYGKDGLRAGQPTFRQDFVGDKTRKMDDRKRTFRSQPRDGYVGGGAGWPLQKSKTLIPQLYEIALAYGINPLTGQPSPAGQWRIRNVVTWARPNPPVGALGDKWRPATSDLIVACTSSKRYWDDLATRKPHQIEPTGEPDFTQVKRASDTRPPGGDQRGYMMHHGNASGAPLLDYWEIPPGGYKGSHYAVFPEELVVPCVKAMCPEKVCRVCGEPSRRIVEQTEEYKAARAAMSNKPAAAWTKAVGTRPDFPSNAGRAKLSDGSEFTGASFDTVGFTDCGHDSYRPGVVLDPFGGSGTVGAVATGHGHDAILIDLDERNADLARERIGPFLFEFEVSA